TSRTNDATVGDPIVGNQLLECARLLWRDLSANQSYLSVRDSVAWVRNVDFNNQVGVGWQLKNASHRLAINRKFQFQVLVFRCESPVLPECIQQLCGGQP